MIESLFSVCAGRVLVDSSTNQASAIDIIEELNSQGFPIIVPTMSLFFYLNRDTEDTNKYSPSITVTLDNKEIFQSPVNLDFGAGLKTRSIINFEGFVVPGPGLLKFTLSLDSKKLGEISIPVKQIELAQPNISVRSS